MENSTLAGLIAVIFLIAGVPTTIYFYPYYVGYDNCVRGGSWENVTNEVNYNATFPRVARYYCSTEADISEEECKVLDSLLNVDGCKWGGKTSARNDDGNQYRLYVLEDPELPITLSSINKAEAIDVGLDNTKTVKRMDFTEESTTTDKELEFEIDNDTSIKDISLFLSDANFNPTSGTLTIKNITTEPVEVWNTTCTVDKTGKTPAEWMEEEICTSELLRTDYRELIQWLPINLKSDEDGIKEKLETFSILGKGVYRYAFKTPLEKTESGYVSAGTVYLGIGSELFVDKQQSSDFNTSFGYRVAIEINNTGAEQLIDGYTLNFTMDTATLISEGKLGSGCDGLEFQYDGTVVQRMFINDTFLGEDRGCDSTVSNLLTRLPENISGATFNDTALFGYYNNHTVVELPLNNGSNLGLHYMGSNFSGSGYDQRTFDYPTNSMPKFEIQVNTSATSNDGLYIYFCTSTPCEAAGENTTIPLSYTTSASQVNFGYKTNGNIWYKQSGLAQNKKVARHNAIVGTHNGSEYLYWINGVRWTNWDPSFNKTAAPSTAYKYMGLRSLNSNMNGQQMFIQRYVNVPPTITLGAEEPAVEDPEFIVELNEPVNKTVLSSDDVSFNFTATGNKGSYLCNLTIDGVINQTNIYAENATNNITTVTNLGDFVRWWSVDCANSTVANTTNTYVFGAVDCPAAGNVTRGIKRIIWTGGTV